MRDPAGLPGARLLFGSPDTPLAGATANTREEGVAGKLFVALKGDARDGHEFLEQAMEAGAACVLIEPRGAGRARALEGRGLGAAVVVPDAQSALAELARRHRAKLGVRIVAVTGSNGKTSTKEFVSAILSESFECVSAPKSFNNAIGVPVTLLSMTAATQAGVLELGMNHPGELTALCRIADPDLVAITSIGPAHMEFFRTERNIALAKSEILTASRPVIPAFLPADSKFLPLLRARAGKKNVWTFGASRGADWRIGNIREGLSHVSFEVSGPGREKFALRCPNFGEHQLTNILLAVAIAAQFAVPFKKMKAAVARLHLPAGRGVIHRAGKHLLIDDSYNANPESMRASLQRVKRLRRTMGGRVALVLGDMLELGDETRKLHRILGAQARAVDPWKVLFVGEQGQSFRRGFLSAGGKEGTVVVEQTVETARPIVEDWTQSKIKTIFLFKASQRLKLEKAVNCCLSK